MADHELTQKEAARLADAILGNEPDGDDTDPATEADALLEGD